MVHPYPRYCASFGYVGRHCYLLTFVTFRRIEVLRKPDVVDLVWTQILRAAREKAFEVLAASFMPDHLHMVVEGMSESSDLKPFAKAAKQYSGYYHAQAHGEKLWQKGNDDIIVRDSADLFERVRYVVNNPVAAGLVARPEDCPFLRSQRWAVDELVDWVRRGGPPPHPGVHLNR
jgi:putative transposase